MRKIAIAAAVLLLIVGGGVYYAFSRLDALVASAIETYGSEITGTAVRVGSVDVALPEGRVRLGELRVANPEGFSNASALHLGEITLAIEPGSLLEQPYVVRTLRIVGSLVNAELAPDGSTNLSRLRRNVEAYSARSRRPASGAAASGQADANPPPRLRVQELVFAEGRLRADATAVGGEVRTVDAPPLTLRDLGGSAGLPSDELAKAVLNAYLQTTTRAAVRETAGARAEQAIDEKLGGAAGEAAKGLLRQFLD